MRSATEHLTEEAAATRVIDLLLAGDLDDALDVSGQLVDQAPAIAPFAYVRALALLQSGDPTAAAGAAEQACALAPSAWEPRYLLARALRAAGQLEGAVCNYRLSIQLEPRQAPVHVCLGVALNELGQKRDAADSYRRALRLDPVSIEARINLGNLGPAALLTDEESRGAVEAREELAARVFQEAERLHAQQDLAGAERLLEQALGLTPSNPALSCNLGVLMIEQQRQEESVPYLRRAVELDPANAYPSLLLASTLGAMGQADESIRLSGTWASSDPASRWSHATMLPVVPSSAHEIKSWRDRLQNELEDVCRSPLPFRDIDQFARLMNPTAFYLAYHGLDDRALLELHARAARAVCPALADPVRVLPRAMPAGSRMRVGFLSRHLYLHSVGRTSCGLIAELDRTRYEVHVLALPPAHDDSMSRFMQQHADQWHAVPQSVVAARDFVRGLELDVVFFQDVGMEPLSFCLAQSRMAPVQCVSFGHPDTSGSNAMDWYISCASFELPGSECHYTERLHCLPAVGNLAYYYRPALPARPLRRPELGLPETGTTYLCPQSLFKFHPEFDAVLAEVLRADPRGVIALVGGPHKTWTARLRARFAATIGDVADRILVLPRCTGEAFLSLMMTTDVMLDTFPFNGYNTSLEAFSVGLPVVTLSHVFQRGRHTAGMYRSMGISDWIARDEAHFVELAVRLGRDPVLRRDASERILERCPVLFENRAVVKGFEDFFERAWREACN